MWVGFPDHDSPFCKLSIDLFFILFCSLVDVIRVFVVGGAFLLVLGCVDCGGFRVEVVVCLWFVVYGLVFFVFDFFCGGIWSF